MSNISFARVSDKTNEARQEEGRNKFDCGKCCVATTPEQRKICSALELSWDKGICSLHLSFCLMRDSCSVGEETVMG